MYTRTMSTTGPIELAGIFDTTSDEDNQFKQAVETLDRLSTEPIERWIDLLPVEQVQRVADMLHAIIERTRRAMALAESG